MIFSNHNAINANLLSYNTKKNYVFVKTPVALLKKVMGFKSNLITTKDALFP